VINRSRSHRDSERALPLHAYARTRNGVGPQPQAAPVRRTGRCGCPERPDRADVQWSPDHSPGNLFGVIGAQPVAVAVPRQTRVRSELGDRARDASPKVVHSNVAPSDRRPDGLFTTTFAAFEYHRGHRVALIG
jgi:hypothetical protein